MSHGFCWSGTGGLLCSWRGLRALPVFQARCQRVHSRAFWFGLESLSAYQCRLFPSVFDASGRGVFRTQIFGRRYSSALPGCLLTHLSLLSLPFRAQPALFWDGWPTRCRLADHQSSSQLVLRFDVRCRLCRGGPRFWCYQVAREGYICLLECFHSGANQTFPRVASESQRSP